jgi:hypothetical protein
MVTSQEPGSFFVRNTWVLYGLGAFAALARIGIRVWLTRRLALEEAIMLFSLLCWTVDTSCIVVTVMKGTNQMSDHERTIISDAQIRERQIGSKAFIAAWYMYITMIWGCKLCIWIFYRKVVDRVAKSHIMQYSLYILAATYVACILSLTFVCHPLSGNWQVKPDPGREYPSSYFVLSNIN